MSDRPLTPWGDRARWWARNVFGPLLALNALLRLVLSWSGWGQELRGTVVLDLVQVQAFVVATAFLVTGLAWLAAEVRAGWAEPR